MHVRELFEADDKVVPGRFGKATNPDIEVPKGYKSFYTKKVSAKGATAIIGVKDDGSEHRISTTSSEELAVKLAKEYNSGGKGGTGLKRISLTKAFGSHPLNALEDAGIKLLEKPGVWADLERDNKYRPLSELEFKKAKNALADAGYKLKTYTDEELWGGTPKGPLVSPKKMPKEECIVVKLSDGREYLVDNTGASTYFRNWRKIGGEPIDDSKLDW